MKPFSVRMELNIDFKTRPEKKSIVEEVETERHVPQVQHVFSEQIDCRWVRFNVWDTHSNAMAEAGARLRTSSTDVVPHGRFLTSRTV